MKHWVFTEAQYERALDAFIARHRRESAAAGKQFPDKYALLLIEAFLNSPEARANKLMGGASYRPAKG